MSYSKTSSKSFSDKAVSKRNFDCSKCGSKHAYRQCPAYGKNCRKCDCKNYFHQVCKKFNHLSDNLNAIGVVQVFLSQDISSSPGEFQTVMNKLVEGMTGTVYCYDDLLVVGGTETELKMRTEKRLRKLTSVGLTINPKKSLFRTGHRRT